MKNILTLIVVLAVLVGGVVYVVATAQKNTQTVVNTTTNDIPATATPAPDQFISASPDTSALRAGGSSHLDSQGVYSFLYPNDYTLDSQAGDPYTRISKRGATQQGQTEIYDGVLIVFESIELKGQSLEEWVDDRIQQAVDNGTPEITAPKKATTLSSYPGFTYQTGGFGSAKYLIVQKDAESPHAVSISYLVADPENKNYQAEVDAVLTTLELLK